MKYDITYIYSGGRKDKLNKLEASDFFYGYLELKNKSLNINFIELSDKKTSFFDRGIIKITKLPIYFFKSLNLKNINILRKSKNLIFINESSYFSFLPLLLVSRKSNSLFLPMGLMNKYNNGNKLTKYIIYISLKYSNKILFIGNGELEEARNKLPKYLKKYYYLPFAVDEKFWLYKDKPKRQVKNLLFIGNDINRDYDLLYKIASSLKNYHFTIVTEYKSKNFEQLTNVNLLEGNWRNGYLKDAEILDLYHSADLVILPIKESSQPSGQSVTLQAMSTGTPVMITKTSGFWDQKTFEDNKNIFFVEGVTPYDWRIKLNSLLINSNILHNISKNGRKTVEDKFTIEMFLINLSNYLVDIEI